MRTSARVSKLTADPLLSGDGSHLCSRRERIGARRIFSQTWLCRSEDIVKRIVQKCGACYQYDIRRARIVSVESILANITQPPGKIHFLSPHPVRLP